MDTSKENLKSIILNQLQKLLDQRIQTAKKAMNAAAESRDNETKSSAGDKYETGRAMMQIEYEKNELQLIKAIELQKLLSHINIKKVNKKIKLGSLVITNQGIFFIAIGFGKIPINKKKYFSISLASPIGKLLFAKKIGEKAIFKNKEFIILDIQ